MRSSKPGGIGISANPEDIMCLAFRREVLVSNKESTTTVRGKIVAQPTINRV